MPKFFFHTEDGTCVRDTDGTELPDVHAARNEAVVILGELVREDPDQFWRDAGFRLTVANEDGLTLYILDLSAVASPTLGKVSAASRLHSGAEKG